MIAPRKIQGDNAIPPSCSAKAVRFALLNALVSIALITLLASILGPSAGPALTPGTYYLGNSTMCLLALPRRGTGALAAFLTTGAVLTNRFQVLGEIYGNPLALALRASLPWLPGRLEHGIVACSHHLILTAVVYALTLLLAKMVDDLSEHPGPR